jgi:formylglycine-generating enzyme required for sulfatase activity
VELKRKRIAIAATRVRLGLTPDEADRLARELATAEVGAHEPGLAGFDVQSIDAVAEERRAWLETAMPAHEVDVGAFEIDVFPVTNADWLAFQNATRAAPPKRGGAPQRFVTGVSWREADAFATWAGMALPTEAEWEVAARDGRSFFPWGDRYSAAAFAMPDDEAWVVGSRPATASKRGVQDLIGKFGEYCADAFAPYAGADVALFERHFPSWRGQRVVRGGFDPYQDATCVSRRGVPDDERRTHLKFRCVRR